ncbi:MAG: hypothetical protein HY748_10535 [Elusimicrobia bacterium]|nr:hypothetical protein [Elusimicrobiota bacterium]
MPAITYECSVNKSHPQRMFAAQPQTVPMCCNKPMVEVKQAAPVAAACPASPGTTPSATAQPAVQTPQTPQAPRPATPGAKPPRRR